MYGHLPSEVPDTRLGPVSLPPGISGYAWLRTPLTLKKEIFCVGRKLGSQSLAMAYNLHYELHGIGCISAAIPSPSRKAYNAFRQLEWDVGFSPAFRFQPINNSGASVRYTPGYVGALSGRTREWHISMNAAASSALNYTALPVSWVLRRALARNRNYRDTVDWLLNRVVLRRAYVVLTSATAACWIVMDPFLSHLQAEVRYPDPLIVGNTEYALDRKPDSYSHRLTDAPYCADEGAWVLDRYCVKL